MIIIIIMLKSLFKYCLVMILTLIILTLLNLESKMYLTFSLCSVIQYLGNFLCVYKGHKHLFQKFIRTMFFLAQQFPEKFYVTAF